MKKVFLQNIGLKITAVIFAILLWLYAVSLGQSEISIDAPVEFKNIPRGLEIVDHGTKAISLSMRGRENLIKNIKPADIRVFIDLSKAKKGENIYYINRGDIKLSRAIAVTSINPSTIKVRTEETITKTIKVRPVIVGSPSNGYYVKSVKAEPLSVVIEGIKSEVRKINSIKTEQFDITGLNETITQELKIDITGRDVRTNINQVKIKVIIEKE
ncbi:MAG: CdaR family protein [Nitrospirota bacterium]